jgi:hypothetical protein
LKPKIKVAGTKIEVPPSKAMQAEQLNKKSMLMLEA